MIDTFTFAVIFIITLDMAMLLFVINHRIIKRSRTKEKQKAYTGGETLKEEEMQAKSQNFYWGIKKALWPFYKYIAEKHTGILSDYLTWILIALIIITITLIGVNL